MFAQRLLLLVLVSVPLLAGSAHARSAKALLDAVIDGQPARVAILLDQGASPEAAHRDGEYAGKSALMWAAEQGDVDAIRLLLSYGAKVDRNNPKGGTALMYAAVAGQSEAIRVLVAAGADPDHRVRHGWTPLLLATAKGHVDSVLALAELGADVDTRDVYGWTLLMRATDRGDARMVATLLDLGLDPAAGDPNGITALGLARRANRPELVQLLEDGPRHP